MELFFFFTDSWFEGLRFSAKWVYSLNQLRTREIKSHEKEAALTPTSGPISQLVWEVSTFCHLRNCLQFCPLLQACWDSFSFSNFLLPVFIPVQTTGATKSAAHVFSSRSQQGIHAIPGRHGVWLLILMGKGEERMMTNDEEECVTCL